MEHTSAENAKNEVLQSIDKMVRKVKEDGEVSLEYMKIFEREEMLIKQGISQGQEMERENTERERQNATREQQRADAAEKRAAEAEQELHRLKKELERLTS